MTKGIPSRPTRNGLPLFDGLPKRTAPVSRPSTRLLPTREID